MSSKRLQFTISIVRFWGLCLCLLLFARRAPEFDSYSLRTTSVTVRDRVRLMTDIYAPAHAGRQSGGENSRCSSAALLTVKQVSAIRQSISLGAATSCWRRTSADAAPLKADSMRSSVKAGTAVGPRMGRRTALV